MSLYVFHVIPTLPIVHNIISTFRTVAMFISDTTKLCFIWNLKVRLCRMFISFYTTTIQLNDTESRFE